jgi:hypothetical protein
VNEALAFLAIGLVAFLNAWGHRRAEARMRDLIAFIDKVDLRSNRRDLELVNALRALAGLPPVTVSELEDDSSSPPSTHTSDEKDPVK